MEIRNPATDEVIADVPADDDASLAAKHAAARSAQPAWAARPLDERLAVLARFRADVATRTEELADLLTAETGKPIRQSRGELGAVLGRLDFFAAATPDVVADEVVVDDAAAGLREVIVHEPLGVVTNISAWNYPWFVGLNVLAPALVTGNAVLYKPSEHATLTGLAIAEAWHAAGVPDDVIAPVVGAGDVGRALLELPVDGVFFTGSYPTGRRIAEALAGSMTRLQLELGGKDPVYVADDVDPVAAAAALADGAFGNAGQSCCSVERAYVHESIHDAVVAEATGVAQSMTVGDPTDEATDLGPLTRAEQLAVLEAQVADAVAKGATVVTGGSRRPAPGAWFEPTVLSGVTHDMAVMREESFGPILPIAAVTNDEEAIALMDDTDYGLTAGVFTVDEARARSILARLDVGSGYWNCTDRVSPHLPWSGRRHSGTGVTLSRDGVATFTRPKALHLRST
jgi:acyl-CoA reductase-like NAD-dependent aldehyde dehydrogenase